jgi:hypothetical protein
MRVDVVIRQLERTLERLSWNAEQQIEYMSRFGVGSDEMALDFDDAFRTTSGMIRQGLMPDSLREALHPVDEILTEMTDSHEDEWDEEAVSESRTWSILRKAAATSLISLKETEFETGSDCDL